MLKTKVLFRTAVGKRMGYKLATLKGDILALTNWLRSGNTLVINEETLDYSKVKRLEALLP